MVLIRAKLKLVKFYRYFSRYNFKKLIRTLFHFSFVSEQNSPNTIFPSYYCIVYVINVLQMNNDQTLS